MGILKDSEHKKSFKREWQEYLKGFYDDIAENDEWNGGDRDLEAWACGCDMSKPFLSEGDKLKVKRYRKEDCKR